MKQKIRLPIAVILALPLCATLISVTVKDKPGYDNLQHKPDSSVAERLTDAEGTGSEPGIEVSDGNFKPGSYILRYNPEENTVVLITVGKDGSRLVSPISSIDTRYLEPEDVKALSEGIELDSREEMYLIIEDYSS